MLGRAPNRPRGTEPLVHPDTGVPTREGMTVLEEMWRQSAPGFPHVPVQVDGTNTLTLTPALHEEGGVTYSDGMSFTGIPSNTSTGPVTASVASLPSKRVFSGAAQSDSGDITAGQVHQFVYHSSLDGGSGGFAAMTSAGPLSATLQALSAFNTNGIVTQTSLAHFAGRIMVPPAKGITITNPAGTAGNFTFFLANALLALQAIGNAGTVGLFKQTAVDTLSIVNAVGSLTLNDFTASGTYTPTSGMIFAIGVCVGGGAGGGGVASSSGIGSGGGGGGGSTSIALLTAAAVGASKAVTVGATAAGGTAGNNDGVAGHDSSIGTLCIGKGGSATGNGAAANTSGSGGAGGILGTGDVRIPGAPGQSGTFSASVITPKGPAGAGGNSGMGFGFGGSFVDPSTAGTGQSGNNYGGGGSGGFSFNTGGAQAGGTGAQGYVWILEFIKA